MQTARKRRLIPRRWVVERTIAWINRCRRLAKDYEILNRTAIAFIRLASIRLTGREIERIYIDKGYRGHDAAKPLRVFKSGQKRGVHGQIKKELRRRFAIEVVIDHCKTDGHLDRNFLHGRLGDQINAVMSAVGYNFRLILRWLRHPLRQIIAAIVAAISPASALRSAS